MYGLTTLMVAWQFELQNSSKLVSLENFTPPGWWVNPGMGTKSSYPFRVRFSDSQVPMFLINQGQKGYRSCPKWKVKSGAAAKFGCHYL
jgi:hypothetical protein